LQAIYREILKDPRDHALTRKRMRFALTLAALVIDAAAARRSVFWAASFIGHPAPLFPYKYPVLFSVSVTFVVIITVSLLDRSEHARQEALAFDELVVRAETGVGAEVPAAH
jgi:Na+(H+)/acetate symporter ActP